jgi:hypothetical protein
VPEWLLRVRDPWGVEVALTAARWQKLVAKHRELAVLGDGEMIPLIAATIEVPDMVYEGRSAPDSKVFYSRPGVLSVRPYSRCRVAVVVRYTSSPASLPSVYLPIEIRANLGTLLFERNET